MQFIKYCVNDCKFLCTSRAEYFLPNCTVNLDSREWEACWMNAVQKRVGEGGVMVTPIKTSLIQQREIWFLKEQIFFPVQWRRKREKIKALLNLKGGVGKCLLASGNTNPSEGAQWQDHKYPCFDHSNTHAHMPLTRHTFSYQFQLIYLCQIQTSAWRHVTHFLCYKTQMVHFESILHKIMKNKCAIIMKIKKQNKIQFYTCYLGPIQTDIHKLLALLYYRTYTIFNLVPEMRLMSSPNSIVHFPIETLQIYSCTFAWSKIITRHLNASRLLSLILACFYKWNRVEVPEETSLKAQ